MSATSTRRARPRLVGPGPVVALVCVALAGLCALQVGAGTSRLNSARRGDTLALAYLEAEVNRHPRDAGRRARLAREQLLLGMLPEAEETLAPLLVGARVDPPEDVVLVALDVAVAAWRALSAGAGEKGPAEAKAAERLERALARASTAAGFAHVGKLARELRRPDLAALAHQKAASLDSRECGRWLSEAARDFLAAGNQKSAAETFGWGYACSGDTRQALALGIGALDAHLAAEMGAEALSLADQLVERFPADREVLERAAAIALAQSDQRRARRFGELLMALGNADAASLWRQLDLQLVVGDLPAAMAVAERLTARSPEDPHAHDAAAKVASWAGRPERALRHLMWLARNGDSLDGIDQALSVSRAIGDESATAELLLLRSRGMPLSSASLEEMATSLDERGSPERAIAELRAYAARHPENPTAREVLAAMLERQGNLKEALATRAETGKRFGGSLSNSIRAARLQWALGRGGEALAELRRWSDTAEPEEAEYWELLAELAWEREADDLARRAYRTLWDSGRIDAGGAERLMALSHAAGRSDEVIRYGRQGWARTRQPRLLLLAMDAAVGAGRWGDLEQMVEEAGSAPGTFGGLQAYWLLRARLAERGGRFLDAAEWYRRALAIDPRSAAARSGVIWMLAGAHDRDGLSECLTAWADEAWKDPGLWRAYAAGLEELGRRREALAFYEREVRADPADEEAVKRYGAALMRAGDSAAATRLGRHLAALQTGVPSRAAPASPPVADVVLGGGGGSGRSDAVGGGPARPGSIRTPGAGKISAEAGAESVGPVLLERQQVVMSGEMLGTELELRAARTGFSSTDSSLRLAKEEFEVLVRAMLPAFGGRNELMGGMSLRSDGNLPRVALAHSRDLASFAQGRLEASLNETADESAAMRVEAKRARVGGSVALAEGPIYSRGGIDWKSWSTRTGTPLGSGGAATMELGWRTQGSGTDARIRLQGGYQRNWMAAGPPPGTIAAYNSAAPGTLPDWLGMAGLGAGAARWAVGPAKITADAWLGWIWPPVRPAYRVQAGVAISPFDDGELSLSGFAGNDRWDTGGNLGVGLSLTQRFSR